MKITVPKKDETKEITKTYAADDKDADLAGKTKKISVTVKAIKVRTLPDLDDDLAQDVNEKFNTLADLKADIKRRVYDRNGTLAGEQQITLRRDVLNTALIRFKIPLVEEEAS